MVPRQTPESVLHQISCSKSDFSELLAGQGSELKYLEFFRLAVIQATSYALNLYEYLKDGSGPLKPAVDSLERTVETVIRPVIQQLQHTPAQLLIQVDNKVSEHKLPSLSRDLDCRKRVTCAGALTLRISYPRLGWRSMNSCF